MTFEAFFVLFVISLAVSAVLHYGFKMYIRDSFESFAATVIWAYVGAWMGGMMFGSWMDNVNYAGVAIIPAMMGAVAIMVVLVDMVKTFNMKMTAK